MLYIDTETTGLSGNDEILEIAVINDAGDILLNTLVKPLHHETWSEAEEIHGITPDMVSDAPTMKDLDETLEKLFKDQELIIYNSDYDTQYLPHIWSSKIHCCMKEFSQFRKVWHDYYSGYRWFKLRDAAEYVLHQWQGKAHRALSDAMECRSVWRYLTDPEEKARVDKIKADHQNEFAAKRELERLEYLEKQRMDGFRFYMTKFLEVWWLKKHRSPDKHWLYYEPYFSRSETLADLFFSRSLTSLDMEDNCIESNLKVYRKKNEIPSRLIPESKFEDTSTWFKSHIQPCAAYIGKKQAYYLYDNIKEPKRIYKAHPLHAPYTVPENKMTVTHTDLLHMGYKKSEIKKMKPIRVYWHMQYKSFYNLYEIDKIEPDFDESLPF